MKQKCSLFFTVHLPFSCWGFRRIVTGALIFSNFLLFDFVISGFLFADVSFS